MPLKPVLKCFQSAYLFSIGYFSCVLFGKRACGQGFYFESLNLTEVVCGLMFDAHTKRRKSFKATRYGRCSERLHQCLTATRWMTSEVHNSGKKVKLDLLFIVFSRGIRRKVELPVRVFVVGLFQVSLLPAPENGSSGGQVRTLSGIHSNSSS